MKSDEQAELMLHIEMGTMSYDDFEEMFPDRDPFSEKEAHMKFAKELKQGDVVAKGPYFSLPSPVQGGPLSGLISHVVPRYDNRIEVVIDDVHYLLSPYEQFEVS